MFGAEYVYQVVAVVPTWAEFAADQVAEGNAVFGEDQLGVGVVFYLSLPAFIQSKNQLNERWPAARFAETTSDHVDLTGPKNARMRNFVSVIGRRNGDLCSFVFSQMATHHLGRQREEVVDRRGQC